MDYTFNNFYELITFQAKKRGSKTALFIDDEKVSYAEILTNVDQLAAYLAEKGVKENDKVALFLRNSAEFIYAVFAISKLGAIVVPINTFLKEGVVFGNKPISNINIAKLINLLLVLPEMSSRIKFNQMIKRISTKPKQKNDFGYIISSYRNELLKERSKKGGFLS